MANTIKLFGMRQQIALAQLTKLTISIRLRLLPGVRKVANVANLRGKVLQALHLLFQGWMIAQKLAPGSS